MTAPLPLPPRKRRRADLPPLEGTVLRGIREAFAILPWVIVWRNNVGRLQDANGKWVAYGLCEGSADLVGLVRVRRETSPEIARFIAIEVKQPGKKPSADQLAFLDVVRAAGGAATWTDNVVHAIGWVNMVRNGEVA